MDRKDEPGPRRISIHGVLLPFACPACGGTDFEASTTPGTAGFEVKLPLLRCAEPTCQRVYKYTRGYNRWDAAVADSSCAFVQLEDLDPYMAQWA